LNCVFHNTSCLRVTDFFSMRVVHFLDNRTVVGKVVGAVEVLELFVETAAFHLHPANLLQHRCRVQDRDAHKPW